MYPNRACIGLLEFLGGMRASCPATCFAPLTTLLGANSAVSFRKARLIVPPRRQRTPGPRRRHIRFGRTNKIELKHSAQRIFLPQLLGDPPPLEAENGCSRELHLSTRSSRNRTHAEIAEGRTGVGTTTLPSANDVVAFCDEIANTPEIEIGKGIAKLGHKFRDGCAPSLWLMHRVVHEYIGCGELVDDSRIPGASPKFLEPPGYDILVIL
jgi:hypothetical protein